MGALIQPGILELLETAGAKPRGNRHDCPKCGGLRTVTHTDETFFCHKCQWKGNTVTLAKELGIYERIPSAEYRELCQKHARAHDAARALYEGVKARRSELLDELHTLNRVELQAHQAGPDNPQSWDTLALVYRERPRILGELDILENANAAALARFLTVDDASRQAAKGSIKVDGGKESCA